jgi:uncharacterized protein
MKVDPGLEGDYARVVVDTNVLLSAALTPHGAPAELVDWLLAEWRLVFSQTTFAELESRIWKPKFDRYLTIEHRKRLLHELNACALWVDIPSAVSAQSFSRDVKDDAFVHAAMAAGSSRLISGDDDLLCLHPLGMLHILSPRAALDEIRELSRGA